MIGPKMSLQSCNRLSVDPAEQIEAACPDAVAKNSVGNLIPHRCQAGADFVWRGAEQRLQRGRCQKKECQQQAIRLSQFSLRIRLLRFDNKLVICEAVVTTQ
jgi:hypothetical protein